MLYDSREPLFNRVSTILAVVLGSVLVLHGYSVKQFNDTLFKQAEHYTEMMVSNEPDFAESDLPHKKLGRFELSWYCPCEKCVGKKKVVKTATGTKPTQGRTIAVDPKKIPLGSIIYIEGYGYFIAEDTGGAIKGNRIDVFVNSHEEALANGKRIANVYLLK